MFGRLWLISVRRVSVSFENLLMMSPMNWHRKTYGKRCILANISRTRFKVFCAMVTMVTL